MTQEDKNIAICVARGLGPFERFNNRGEKSKTGKHLRYKQDEGGGAYSWQPLPNHFKCLNACHEMEKQLMIKTNAGELVTSYIKELSCSHERWATSCFATAYQRAEAFGRTLNLW